MTSDPVHLIKVTNTTLDARATGALLAEAVRAFEDGKRAIVIDLGAVTYVDSLGISAIVAIFRRAPAGSRIALAALTPRVQAVARLTRLYQVFPIYAAVEDAIRAEAIELVKAAGVGVPS